MKIGVLAAGQLGRMMALEGYNLGLQFRFLEPAHNAPASVLAECIQAEYCDFSALERFAEGLDVVTYEFENVPVDAAQYLAERLDFYPPPVALKTAQDRLSEKLLFDSLNIPTAPYRYVDTLSALREAVEEIGPPVVLKSCRMGYDGKGQCVLHQVELAANAWESLGGVPMICEAFIPFERELSIVAVRSRSGETAFYPLVENHHSGGILRLTLAPAPDLDISLQALAQQHATAILDHFGYVGVLTIEWFEHDGRLLANETASRVHNSGHWTLEGAVSSQFENHLRAIVDWPLGGTEAIGSSAMVNLIGEMPSVRDVLAVRGAHVHLYGKTPRPGRKLGHITVCASSHDELQPQLDRIRSLMEPCGVLIHQR